MDTRPVETEHDGKTEPCGRGAVHRYLAHAAALGGCAEMPQVFGEDTSRWRKARKERARLLTAQRQQELARQKRKGEIGG